MYTAVKEFAWRLWVSNFTKWNGVAFFNAAARTHACTRAHTGPTCKGKSYTLRHCTSWFTTARLYL